MKKNSHDKGDDDARCDRACGMQVRRGVTKCEGAAPTRVTTGSAQRRRPTGPIGYANIRITFFLFHSLARYGEGKGTPSVALECYVCPLNVRHIL
jgi:hypothetical protein